MLSLLSSGAFISIVLMAFLVQYFLYPVDLLSDLFTPDTGELYSPAYAFSLSLSLSLSRSLSLHQSLSHTHTYIRTYIHTYIHRKEEKRRKEKY